MKINEQLRAEAVANYLAGQKNQRQFCTEFEARTGIPLSQRTLRSWISARRRHAVSPGEVRVRLLQAHDHLRELQVVVESVLGALREQDCDRAEREKTTAPRAADDPAAAPAASAPASGEASDPAAGDFNIAATGAAAADLPYDTSEDAARASMNFSFWDD